MNTTHPVHQHCPFQLKRQGKVTVFPGSAEIAVANPWMLQSPAPLTSHTVLFATLSERQFSLATALSEDVSPSQWLSSHVAASSGATRPARISRCVCFDADVFDLLAPRSVGPPPPPPPLCPDRSCVSTPPPLPSPLASATSRRIATAITWPQRPSMADRINDLVEMCRAVVISAGKATAETQIPLDVAVHWSSVHAVPRCRAQMQDGAFSFVSDLKLQSAQTHVIKLFLLSG